MIAYLHRYFVPHSAEQGYSLAIQVSCVVCEPLFVAGDAEMLAAVQRAATVKPGAATLRHTLRTLAERGPDG